jgi:osmoprotectant transport system permease protein
MEFINFMIKRSDWILELVIEHIWLVIFAILIAIVVGVMLGVIASYYSFFANIIIPATQITMCVPSISLMGLLIPFIGIGLPNAIVCLVVYSLLAIVRNTYTGFKEIPPNIIQAAQGMGMTESWILFKIKIPLALPVIIAGIRSAVVMIIGIGAIMAYIGAGGLGNLIFRGIDRTRPDMILTGAIFISILSISADILFSRLESHFIKKRAY